MRPQSQQRPSGDNKKRAINLSLCNVGETSRFVCGLVPIYTNIARLRSAIVPNRLGVINIKNFTNGPSLYVITVYTESKIFNRTVD